MSNNSFYHLSNQIPAPSSDVSGKRICLISKCREDLKFIIKELNKLRENAKQTAAKLKEIDDHEYELRMSEMKKQQEEISSRLQKYVGTELLAQIQLQLKQRKKKRERIKRRKTQLKLNAKIIREQLHKYCDDWVKRKVEADLEKKRLREAAEHSESVLASVNKRISSAKKYLRLFEMIVKLRKCRQRSQPSSSQDNSEEVFLEKIARLKAVWEDALLDYNTEKKKLQSFLDETTKSVEQKWNEILFGEGYETQTSEVKTLEQLIEIRRSWDAYIVPSGSGQGSSIPLGWVLPNENPSDEWKKYLKHQKKDN